MYIIAIAWLYVTVLIAVTEPNVTVSVISFLFYGLLPCALLLWLGGSKARRRRRKIQELLADQRANHDDRSDAKPDQ